MAVAGGSIEQLEREHDPATRVVVLPLFWVFSAARSTQACLPDVAEGDYPVNPPADTKTAPPGLPNIRSRSKQWT